jgi:hypothetical protein
MPHFPSDTNNPNNASFNHPERHPHYGRPWLDSVHSAGGEDDDDEAYSEASSPESVADSSVDSQESIPVWLFDHS